MHKCQVTGKKVHRLYHNECTRKQISNMEEKKQKSENIKPQFYTKLKLVKNFSEQ